MVVNARSDARRETALIVEGGAMRGAWAAGVLAYLQESGRKQYDLVYAASSGACSAAYFVADIWEPCLVIWRELACNVVRKSNFLRRKPIIDLAYPEYPDVARVWTAQQNVNYNAAFDLMKQPPAGVRIQVFRPLRPLPVGSFTVEQKLIAAALLLGHDEALQQLEVMEGKPLGGSVSD